MSKTSLISWSIYVIQEWEEEMLNVRRDERGIKQGCNFR